MVKLLQNGFVESFANTIRLWRHRAANIGKIARWSANLAPSADWEFYTPKKGWKVTVNGGVSLRGVEYQYNGSAWVKLSNLPVYADQVTATAAGLLTGELFITSAGALMVKL